MEEASKKKKICQTCCQRWSKKKTKNNLEYQLLSYSQNRIKKDTVIASLIPGCAVFTLNTFIDICASLYEK